MRLVEKEEATEREMERGEKCRHGRERKEGERERERNVSESQRVLPTPSILRTPSICPSTFPPLAISRLTHRSATEQKGDGERDGEKERTIDLSECRQSYRQTDWKASDSRDSEGERARNPSSRGSERSTSSTKLGIRNRGGRFLNGATRSLPNIP